MTRSPRPRAYAPDPDAPGRPCDHPGCLAAGAYRAPKSRTSLNQYWWLCLEHVRAYNARWDFYKGMTADQIEAQVRLDTQWQRPTWPLGRNGAALPHEDVLRDPLGRFDAAASRPAPKQAVPAALRDPLSTLGLDWPVSLGAVKTRYKELAKRHHPDANGGDRAAEERLKTINLAYAALRTHLTAEPGLAATG